MARAGTSLFNMPNSPRAAMTSVITRPPSMTRAKGRNGRASLMSAQVSAGPASRTTQEMAAKPSVKPTATMSDRFDMPLLGDIVISVVNARLFKSSLGPATTPQLVELQMDELRTGRWRRPHQARQGSLPTLDRGEVCPSPLIRVSFSSRRVRSTSASARPCERKHDISRNRPTSRPRGGWKRT